jgi:hypothetical protein
MLHGGCSPDAAHTETKCRGWQMSAVEELGTFLTLQARSLCEGRSFLGVAGAFRGALLLRTIRFFETTPPLAARSSFTAPVIQNANS